MTEKLPFELSEWLKDKSMKIVDEKGMPVRIIAWDRKCMVPGEGAKKPVLALVQRDEYDLNERLIQCTENGMEYTPQHGFSQAIWMVYEWKPAFKPGDIIIRDGITYDVIGYDKKSGRYTMETSNPLTCQKVQFSIKEQEGWRLTSRKRTDIVEEYRKRGTLNNVVSSRFMVYETPDQKARSEREDKFFHAYLDSLNMLVSNKSICNYNGIPHVSSDAVPVIKEHARKLYYIAKNIIKDEPLTVTLGEKEVEVKFVPVDGTVKIKLHKE